MLPNPFGQFGINNASGSAIVGVLGTNPSVNGKARAEF